MDILQLCRIYVNSNPIDRESNLNNNAFVKPPNHMPQTYCHQIIPSICIFLINNPRLGSRPIYDEEPDKSINLGHVYDEENNKYMKEEIV